MKDYLVYPVRGGFTVAPAEALTFAKTRDDVAHAVLYRLGGQPRHVFSPEYVAFGVVGGVVAGFTLGLTFAWLRTALKPSPRAQVGWVPRTRA